MQEIPDNRDLPKEFMLIEALLEEPNFQGGQSALPVKAISNVREYVKASDAVLILFDRENPGWANKKLLGTDKNWNLETAFLRKDSVLCDYTVDYITSIEYTSESDARFDHVLFTGIARPIRNVILAPLVSNSIKLGIVLFINAAFDANSKEQYEFLKLIARGIANAILTAERNRQLIVTNADLEAAHWQILNSRNTLRTFFDNIPSNVFIIDRSYTIIAINDQCSQRFGKLPEQMVGEKCYEKMKGLSAPCATCRAVDAFNGIPSVRTEREISSNETVIHWEINTVPIREEDNSINWAIVFEEDVTEKLIMEANLIQSEKMASIGQLAANVAHEINNPLAAIIANAQLLMRDLADADEDTIDALKLIETAGDRAAKIVNNLLESARRDKHHEFEQIPLNETITDAISLLRYEINKRSISIKLDLAKEMPPILANKNQLKGVWINMVNNALGAIESNKGKIMVSTRYANKQFQVVIADNGKGIQLEHQEHIFEPFFTTKEAGKGTGLGLSVSLQAIKEHHGNIEFESKPGKGTKFIITLPDIDVNNS
jgi:two-component system, NtrC family, sensor kinase